MCWRASTRLRIANESLGRFELAGTRSASSRQADIEISVEIGISGTVSVTAWDRDAGRGHSYQAHPRGSLSQTELEHLVAEVRARDAREKARSDHESVVHQLDGLMANTKRSLQVLQGKLTSGERERIIGVLEAAQKIKSRPAATLAELNEALARLERAAGIIGQAMLRH
jgi:molecular chaperone DnaK (HSP70)